MPIGKNSIARAVNKGYSKETVEATDIKSAKADGILVKDESSKKKKAPSVKAVSSTSNAPGEEKNLTKKCKTNEKISLAENKEKSSAKKTTVTAKKTVEHKKTSEPKPEEIKTLNGAEENKSGTEYINIGRDIPYYLL